MKGKRSKAGILVAFIALLLVAVAFTVSAGGGQEKAKPADKLKVGVYAYGSVPVMEWDPATMYSDTTIVFHNCYETLLRYVPAENRMVPVLATEYAKSADGLVWTFKIRQGVRFHDGTVLDAQAVKFSIDRTIRIGKGAAFIWDSVKEIRAVGADTVEFHLKYAAPLDLVAASAYAAFIHSPAAARKDPEKWFNEKDAGTGPYAVESISPDQTIMTRFADYWGGWQQNQFDKVVIKGIPEVATRRQMVEAGDITITATTSVEDLEAMRRNPELVTMQVDTLMNTACYLNTRKAAAGQQAGAAGDQLRLPLRQRGQVRPERLRRADPRRPAQADVGLQRGDPAVQLRSGQGEAAAGPGRPPQGRLQAALHLHLRLRGHAQGGRDVQDRAGQGGVELEIRAMPWDSEWELAKSPRAEDRQDICTFRWWPDVVTPDSWLKALYHSEDKIIFNLGYYKNAAVDKLIDDGIVLSGTDRAAAAKKFVEAQKIIMDEAPVIPHYDQQTVYVVNKRMKGFKPNPAYQAVVSFYECTWED